MKLLIVLSILFGLTHQKPHYHPLSDEMIDYINSLNLPWKACKNFHESQLSYVKEMLGIIPSDTRQKSLLSRKIISIAQDIPASFDAREHWPECPSIGLIRDQGGCGSCWALASVEAISDRICIASKGQININISAEDLTGCCKTSPDTPDMLRSFGCDGCKGGVSFSGWKYWVERGLVTGDLYNGGGCQPYTLPPGFYGTVEKQEEPKCTKQCRPGYPRSYEDDKIYGESFYSIDSSVKEIQTEILQNGPVTAAFTAYDDFFNFGDGIYVAAGEPKNTNHLIKILGWGIEDGVDYWLAANSWGTGWGKLGGFFKIRRGTNECGIEGEVYAGVPKLP